MTRLDAGSDIDCSAELFVATSKGRQASITKYRRFTHLADAIRYAVEIVGLSKNPSTIIECAEVKLNSLEIADRYTLLMSEKPS